MDDHNHDGMSMCECDLCRETGRQLTPRQHQQCRDDPAWVTRWKEHEANRKSGRFSGQALHEPPKKRGRIKTFDDFPCIHRGNTIETIPCRPCQNAGRSGAEVRACAIHGRCTATVTYRRGTGEVLPACSLCELWGDRIEPP